MIWPCSSSSSRAVDGAPLEHDAMSPAARMTVLSAGVAAAPAVSGAACDMTPRALQRKATATAMVLRLFMIEVSEGCPLVQCTEGEPQRHADEEAAKRVARPVPVQIDAADGHQQDDQHAD